MRLSLDSIQIVGVVGQFHAADYTGVSICERPRSRRGPRVWRTAHRGSCKPGRPRRFHHKRGRGTPLIKSRRDVGCATTTSENTHRMVILRSEGNEATQDELRGVGASRSTDEAGEPDRGTPWREGQAGRDNRWRER